MRWRAGDAAWMAAVVGVSVALAAGAALRLADPLGNPVLAAEDPYTHLVLVREHLRDGSLEPRNPGEGLYPPGLHGLLAAWWLLGGGSLYDLTRVAGAVWGVLGIAGVALLLARHEGPLAAVVGAVAVALMPEHILRSDLTAPTALDLVVVPALLLALLEMVRGRRAWAAAAIPSAAFLALAHPWAMALVAGAGFAFIVLMVAAPWPASRAPPPDPWGTAGAIGVIGGGLALAVATLGGSPDPAFQLVMDALSFGAQPQLLLAMLLVTAALAAGAWVGAASVRARPQRPWTRRQLAARAVAGAVLLLVGLVPLALLSGLPAGVHVPRMLGWPVLALAAVALALLPGEGSPLGHAGAALLLAGLPFALRDPFGTGFLPNRTVVYLGLAAVLLAGVGAARLAGLVARALARRRASPRQRAHAPAALAAIVVACLAVGGVAAAMPAPFPAWYRYHDTCGFEALKALGERVDAEPRALVVVASWQSQMVVRAFADDAGRVWFFQAFFGRDFDRGGFLAGQLGQHSAVYVVADRYLGDDKSTGSFLRAPPYEPVGMQCPPPPGAKAQLPLTIVRVPAR